ncbi:hypothetical protein RhiXN_01975 [Rhizoctonia solani]|uniref:RING-type domain-containing protein n=1 Tax=Rhizoctonia solani TaxID=456999 RepID=A0A8H8P8Z7_9AGAM|nr:uncharacterized protein RhiXN_01975 [Rhizoctonia solani]QRW27380.1 hypothetical protein RhiXN_01975 [Rhizoctonia solani]
MQTSSSDNSIWEYVHCSVCMVLFLPPNHPDPVPDIPFWLTECGHVVCNNHLMADQSCASCGAKNPSIVPLQRNMSPPVSEWFRPLSDAHESLVMASRIQHNMFVALIRHYRQRYDAAKIMIRQLQTELESLRSQLNSQRYLAASPRLGILEQRDLYDNLYSSSSGSASKRRRIDVEGAVSSPHSSSTPNRPTRAFNDNSNITAGYESGGLTQTIEHQSHSLNHRLNPTSISIVTPRKRKEICVYTAFHTSEGATNWKRRRTMHTPDTWRTANVSSAEYSSDAPTNVGSTKDDYASRIRQSLEG